MPEGDTVWHTAAALRRHLLGGTLTRCDVRVPRYATVDLTGQVVDEVLSRGKHLFIRVGQASIHSHVKMEGSWRVGERPVRGGSAAVAAVGAVPAVVPVPAAVAHLHVAGGDLARGGAVGDLHPVDGVAVTFVVDQGPRPELGDGDAPAVTIDEGDDRAHRTRLKARQADRRA